MASKTILVLGSSYGGISSAHYTLKHIIPALPNKGEGYTVTLVGPTDQFFARPASPRAVVSTKLIPTEKCFFDFQKHFKQYGEGKFTYIKGIATASDTSARTVTITKVNGETETISYYALVIATGTRTPSPLLSLHTDDQYVKDAWKVFQEALPNAKSIVIAGGGPASIETAGELGEFLNGKAGFFSSKLENPKVPITVVTMDSKILPILRPSLATKAETLLAKLGVTVIKNAKVESVSPVGAGQEDPSTNDLSKIVQATTITLSNGKTLEADIYLPATGVTPNTDFLSKDLLNEKGYVDNNGTTLRVDKAGPRVYAVGDVGSYTVGGILDIYDAVPICMTNMKRDLLHYATLNDSDAMEAEKAKPAGKDRPYKWNKGETQLVPIGRSSGVGAVFGWRLPGFMVWAIKGRDYMLGFAEPIYTGSKWDKESKWSG